MEQFNLLLLLFCICGNLAQRSTEKATTTPEMDSVMDIPITETASDSTDAPISSDGPNPNKHCNPVTRVNISDVSDLFRWVKHGKPPVQCSYKTSDSSQIFASLERTRSRTKTAVVPIDDGFDYTWTPSSSEGVSFLSRTIRKDSNRAESSVLQKVFIPEAGINAFVELDQDFGRVPIHGFRGFYGYDFYDGNYTSPTKTNAEEDLIFNVTMAATVLDIMNMLFPEKLREACLKDEHADIQFTTSKPQRNSYRTGNVRSYYPLYTPDLPVDPERHYPHIHSGPVPTSIPLDIDQIYDEDHSLHNRLGRRLLTNFRFLASEHNNKNEVVFNRPVFRPLGERKHFKNFNPTDQFSNGAEVVF